jgi:hypothetical protein
MTDIVRADEQTSPHLDLFKLLKGDQVAPGSKVQIQLKSTGYPGTVFLFVNGDAVDSRSLPSQKGQTANVSFQIPTDISRISELSLRIKGAFSLVDGRAEVLIMNPNGVGHASIPAVVATPNQPEPATVDRPQIPDRPQVERPKPVEQDTPQARCFEKICIGHRVLNFRGDEGLVVGIGRDPNQRRTGVCYHVRWSFERMRVACQYPGEVDKF